MKLTFKTKASRTIPVNFYYGYFVDDRTRLTETPISRKPFFSAGGVGCPPSRPSVVSLGKGGFL